MNPPYIFFEPSSIKAKQCHTVYIVAILCLYTVNVNSLCFPVIYRASWPPCIPFIARRARAYGEALAMLCGQYGDPVRAFSDRLLRVSSVRQKKRSGRLTASRLPASAVFPRIVEKVAQIGTVSGRVPFRPYL
jgi:hypothetical protein